MCSIQPRLIGVPPLSVSNHRCERIVDSSLRSASSEYGGASIVSAILSACKILAVDHPGTSMADVVAMIDADETKALADKRRRLLAAN